MGLEYSKLTPRQVGELLKLFVAGSTARTAAELVGVHRDTAALFFSRVRSVIAAPQEREMAAAFHGPAEIDGGYFGGRRKGKRGRGAAGRVAVFGVLKRGGRVVGSSDKAGGYPATDPQTPENLAATIYSALGIPKAAAWHDAETRPHFVYSGDPMPVG